MTTGDTVKEEFTKAMHDGEHGEIYRWPCEMCEVMVDDAWPVVERYVARVKRQLYRRLG